jgi:hypothetical protein
MGADAVLPGDRPCAMPSDPDDLLVAPRDVVAVAFGILVDHRGVEVSRGLELQVERFDRRPTTKPSAKAPIAASSMGFSRAIWAGLVGGRHEALRRGLLRLPEQVVLLDEEVVLLLADAGLRLLDLVRGLRPQIGLLGQRLDRVPELLARRLDLLADRFRIGCCSTVAPLAADPLVLGSSPISTSSVTLSVICSDTGVGTRILDLPCSARRPASTPSSTAMISADSHAVTAVASPSTAAATSAPSA